MMTQQLEIKLSKKMEENIKKAGRKSTRAGNDFMPCVDLYNRAQSTWFEEMVTTTLELEWLEVERVEMIWQHLCRYTQLRQERDMFNQSTVEPVDQLLQKVDLDTDRELWVREHKTGNILWPWRSRHACVALGKSIPGEGLGVPWKGGGGSHWVKLPSHCPVHRGERRELLIPEE
ncbi:Growth arrest-specific protein 7 [Sciurus carolinensis]|uniref:Growth arrest-specific protein 7 n=1 Tax=Sciurus carolinensis TaxID=30640 RepID=A0AA41NG16_SCICA|nr:Growth arrest-specific protein 7 [Sciurus carolinensis]